MGSNLPPSVRLVSLDVFRGATIASMILVNNAGDWDHVYPPLLHARWHGWTFTDLIYPFFLWIAGVAMTLSFARRMERGADRVKLLGHVLRRSAVIFALGLLLNGFPYYRLDTIRIPGVLQRIAICYLIAAAIFLYSSVRGQMAWIVILLSGYWTLMTRVPVPGHGAGVLEPGANFANWVDALFLSGHMWSHTKFWDPEGIVSTIPAIATVLFGVLAGHILRTRREPVQKTVWLLLAGNTLLFAGAMLSTWMPINKMIWTSSYAVFTAGMAFVCFAFCFWFADVLGRRGWTRPFVIFGMNAIAVYVLSGVLARGIGLLKWHDPILRVFQTVGDPYVASLLYALAHVLVLYGIAWLLYRRQWFLRV
ncbi:MAG: acyltransferase family protein [Bryobacteraceae bacterium]